MLYRLFLYGSTAQTGTAPALGYTNLAISTNDQRQWKDNWAACFLRPFDTDRILQYIRRELTDPVTGSCKCHPTVKYPPKEYEQIGFLYIATSYAKAAQVLPRLHAIASENDLVLFDAETNRTFYRELVDHTYITLRNRQQALQQAILQEMKPVWKIRRLMAPSQERGKMGAYAVTIQKDPKVSFAERNLRFYKCLQEHLQDDEELECEDQCYHVLGRGYAITYVLEGYKKHPNQIGFVDGGIPRVALLHRMGAEEACRWLDHCTKRELDDIHARMQFREMKLAYPNPARRLAESVNISKWQKKQVFGIRYSGIGYYGAEILFHVVPDRRRNNAKEISVFKLEEESAGFILPFIVDIYPEFYKRYYMDENHLSSQMWQRIVNRLKQAKEMVLHDTLNPVLKPYIHRMNLYILEDHSKRDTEDTQEQTDDIHFFYEHRYQVGALLDAFIQWSEAQLRVYGERSDLMFNIQGP